MKTHWIKVVLAFIAMLLQPVCHTLAHAAESTEGHGIIDYVIVGIGVLVVVAVLILTIKYLLRPGEKSQQHIKRRILDDERQGDRDDN